MLTRVSVVLMALVSPLALQAQNAQNAALPPGEHKSIGVGMMKEADGPLSISDVRKGSPAEKAGLKVGDQVVTVAGLYPEELDPDRLHAISDTAKFVPFVVIREGVKMTVKVEPVYIPGMGGGQRVERRQ